MIHVSLHDFRGRYLCITRPARGFTTEGVVGKHAWELTAPPDRAKVEYEWVRATVHGECRDFSAVGIDGVRYDVVLYPIDLVEVKLVCVARPTDDERLGLLTLREREVFDHTTAGRSIKQVAKHLGLSVQRVCNIRSIIRKKLGLAPTAWATLRRNRSVS